MADIETLTKIETLTTENYYPGDRVNTRYAHLSRGRCWGRQGTGAEVTWAPTSGSEVTLPAPGKWVVGSDDGYSRRDKKTYVVVAEPATLTDEQITAIRAATTSAAVIEACDAALVDGDAAARRNLSRRYAEVAAAERKRIAAERKAERAASAAAEAAARAAAEVQS